MITGFPQPSDLIGSTGILDLMAKTFRADWQTLGRNQSGESGTAAVEAYAFLLAMQTALPQSYQAQQGAANFAMRHQYDRFYAGLVQPILFAIEGQVQQAVKAVPWTLINKSAGVYHYLDGHLLRINACHPGVLPAIGGTLTLTAVNNAAGALPNCASGNCPYFVVTAVANDYDESVISAPSAQIALTGSKNAFTLAISGNVPTPAPTKLRIYSSGFGGASTGPFVWDQDETSIPASGSPWGTVATIVKPDSQHIAGTAPPAFMCCPQFAETAFLWADAFASAPPSSPNIVYIPGSVTLATPGMLNPFNVALNGCNEFLGLGNTPPIGSSGLIACAASGIMGLVILGTGFTAGSILTANNAAGGLQGFAGAWGGGGTASFKIQARAIGSLNGTLTPTVSYSYYDVTHPGSNIQTQAGVVVDTPFAGGVAGETQTFTVTAGRVPVDVVAYSATGSATTGELVFEAQYPR